MLQCVMYHLLPMRNTSSAGTSLDKRALKAGVCVGMNGNGNRNKNGNRNGNGNGNRNGNRNGNTYIFEAKPVLGWTTRWLHRYTTSSLILGKFEIATIVLVINLAAAWLQPAWHDGGCDVDQDQAEVAETVEQRRLLNTYIPYAIYGNVQSL